MFPRGEKNEAYQAVFTGVSYLASLVDESLPVSVSHVTFEPETRNHWHIHDGGYQILLVTEGEGCYQEEGRPARHLHAGDVVVTHDGLNTGMGQRALPDFRTWRSLPENPFGSRQFRTDNMK